MPAIHESAYRLLERVFVEAWGDASPVKLTRTGRIPLPPYVGLSAVWRSAHGNDDEQSAKGLFSVVVSVRAEQGMDTALELLGRAVETLEFRQFKGNGFVVNCREARVGGSASRSGALHSLIVHFDVSAEVTD